ncbi:MAG: hypothetical protein M0Q88_00070 [Bacilli bacterium]|nr:hypothetical protein [Bacilli bacterium]
MKEIRICRYCGEEYEATRKDNVSCTKPECRHKHRLFKSRELYNKVEVRVCSRCGDSYEISKQQQGEYHNMCHKCKMELRRPKYQIITQQLVCRRCSKLLGTREAKVTKTSKIIKYKTCDECKKQHFQNIANKMKLNNPSQARLTPERQAEILLKRSRPKRTKEEVSKLLSDKMLANNPMKRPEVVLKSIETRKKNRFNLPKKAYINIKEVARVYLYKWKDRELKRAHFKCELCGDDKGKLMVHHHKRKYKDIFFECCRKIGTAPSKLRVGTAEFDSLIYELRKYHEENTDLAQVLCERCHAEVDQHFRQFRKDIQNEN